MQMTFSKTFCTLVAIALSACPYVTAIRPVSLIQQATTLRRSSALVETLPFYHSGADLSAEARRLARSCSGAQLSVETRSEGGVSMDLVRVKGLEGTNGVNNRMFIASGEHARELIGSETALHFLRMLCGQVPWRGNHAENVLSHTEFAVVMNSNPLSRERVDEGDYCWRANPQHVDLNRNWDEHWVSAAETREKEGGTGPRPFSESESSLLKSLISEFKPTTYISVHSGTYGMYMPWAFSTTADLAQGNQASMLEVLRDLDSNYCTCPFGAAGKEVGYSCPGTSIDYVYDKLDTPFVFAFEIYVAGSRDDYTRRWQSAISRAASLLQVQGGRRVHPNDLGHPAFADFFRKHPSDFVMMQTNSSHEHRQEASEDPNWCLHHYNPQTEQVYNETVDNWAAALLDVSALISEKIRNGTQRPPKVYQDVAGDVSVL